MYDRFNHTYEWTTDIYADIVWYVAFEDVPPIVQNYIVARAARLSATKMIGDKEITALLAEQEIQTKASALEYECNQGDYSVFGWQDGTNYYNSYQPYTALMR